MNESPESLANLLGEAGYAVALERFTGRASAEPWLASYAGLSAVAALLVYPLPLAAVLVGVVAVVLHARESDGRPLLRSASCESVNVVARAPAAAPPDLVVVAGLVPERRRLRGSTARALGLCLQTLMAAVPAAAAAAWVEEAGKELPRTAGTGGVVAAVAIAALVLAAYRPPEGNEAHANPPLDAMVALAPVLRDRPVWLVGAGPGADAVPALVEAHDAELAGAAWLNLASSASGDLVAVSEEGTWRERRADRWLMGVAEEAGAEVRPHRAGTRATPLLARRRRAITLLVPEGDETLRVVASAARAAGARR